MGALAERRIDIRKLIVDVPARVEIGPFDPVEQITGDMWRSIGERFKSLDMKGSFRARKALFEILCLNADAVGELNLKLPDFVPGNVPNLYMQDREILKMVAPDFSKTILRVDSPKFQQERELLMDWHRVLGTGKLESLASLRRLIPDDLAVRRFGREYVFGEWNSRLPNLSAYIQVFTKVAANLRVICPERFAEVKVPDGFWPAAQKLVESLWKIGYEADFVDFVFYLRILAADKLELGEGGMELTFDNRNLNLLKEQVVELPEMRRF